ncbi:acyl-CoA dehydrogenase family protein [Cupriavidus numazuensis]|uniref:glutaryl-CoA dehydrogenase (ETF) n=1 Tax=Cupriavidus numazuensis TaxID=221992 RepID=A0ABM8TUW7_9BURK|nr:acyl-CoA dehydrogenase family protein [Cupriavidus numazuensis]CAG2160372.1 Acyl-CoA dehydrogenase [Cupriavidus numazuensis]
MSNTAYARDEWLLPAVLHGESEAEPLDFLALQTLLTAEERNVQAATRKFAETTLAPEIKRWFSGRPPLRELAAEFGRQGLFGTMIGSGVTKPAAVAFGLRMLELEALDTSFRQLVSTQDNLVMFTLARYGSDEQCAEWLPQLRSGEALGCFGMTEPSAGSDPAAMRTVARRDGDDWVITGSKRWITNGVDADIAIVWAKTEDGMRGFLVPTRLKGFSAADINDKVSMRHSSSAQLELQDVRVPSSAMLPHAKGVHAPLSCTSEARYGILWGAVGAARACYDAALHRALDRMQFGNPLAAFQLTQQRLVAMCSKVNAAGLLAIHLGRLREAGCATAAQLSLGKLENVRAALEVARDARALHGGDGVTLTHSPIRHLLNLEAVSTYEGTHEIHTLAVGRALTGISAFR